MRKAEYVAIMHEIEDVFNWTAPEDRLNKINFVLQKYVVDV